jgi:hypothetical protein
VSRSSLGRRLATVTVLVAAGLSACTDSTESYCSTLREDQEKLRALAGDTDGRGAGSLVCTVRLLSDLRDRAPEQVETEWDTLVDALRDLADAVRASGADLDDFTGGRRPPGVSTGQLQAVRQAAAELRSTPVQQAGQSIEQHAVDVCEVDLGGGLGGGGQ